MHPKPITLLLLFCLSFLTNDGYAQKELWGPLTGALTGPVVYNYGAIVKTDSIGDSMSIVHLFDSVGGKFPGASFLQASDGNIYGTTNAGGVGNTGVLFQYNPVLDSFRVLANFGNPSLYLGQAANGLIEVSPGLLYGTSNWGTGGIGENVYAYNITTGLISLAVGIPNFTSGLITVLNYASGPLYKASDGYIYGTTGDYSDYLSGVPYIGSVFRIDPATNIFSYMFPFSYTDTDGQTPLGGFVEAGGKLYSVTYSGADSGDGAFFAYDLATHAYEKKINLDDSTGTQPNAPFMQASNGKFYGYVNGGIGAAGAFYESLYEYDPSTNVYGIKRGFLASDPIGTPFQGIMQASNGKIYGTGTKGIYEYDITTDSIRLSSPFVGASWKYPFIEICRKPTYKYYSNTNDSLCVGSSFALNLHNTNAQTFVWQHNGVTDTTQTTGILNFTSVALIDSGTWACTMTNECGVTIPPAIHITVNTVPSPGPIAGTASVCEGSTTALTDAGGGTWSSSNTSVATVASSAGIVSGISGGTATITYTVTNSCGVGIATIVVTVVPFSITVPPIIGTDSVCTGAFITLTDAVTGGTWSASNLHATVGSGGEVVGMSAGIDTITYTVLTIGSCSVGFLTATYTVTVNPTTYAGSISGPAAVCVGSSVTLIDTTSGGAWHASNTDAIVTGGVVTGVTTGTDTIFYTVLTGSCSSSAVAIITVSSTAPTAGSISGLDSVCTSAFITLTDAATGGTWSSGATAVATVSSAGIVTGVSAGTAIISYTVTNPCGSAVATKPVTVDLLSAAGAITGVAAICITDTATFTDLPTGGTWSTASALITIAAVNGFVEGIAAGIATISYTVTGSCGAAVATKTITLNPLPASIGNGGYFCIDTGTHLTEAATGGAWSSNNTGVATVDSITGFVTGISAGAATITYTAATGCYVTAEVNPVLCRDGIPLIVNKANSLELYPNPATTTLTISSNTVILSGAEGQITITNLLGQKVFSNNYNAEKVDVDLAGLPSGVYFIKVNGSEVRKFVKE